MQSNKDFKKEMNSISSNEDSHLPVEMLIDDCLIYIFELLTIPECIIIERVSKRWKDVVSQCLSKFKALDINSQYLVLNFHHEKNYFACHLTDKVLKRFGRQLEKIYCSGKMSVDIIKNLSNNCENLSELVVKCELIKKFEKELGKLFSNNKKLQVVNFQKFHCSVDCLMKLSLDNMITIKITSDYGKNKIDDFTKVLEQTKLLSKLQCQIFHDKILTTLKNTCSSHRTCFNWF